MRLLEDVREFLEWPRSSAVSTWNSPWKECDPEVIDELLNLVRSYIRERLVIENDAEAGDYLSGLFDFAREDTLDVFTMNYDRLVEATCFRHGIRFTTGFGDEWNPDLFALDVWDLRLHKLHGSVDWFRLPELGIVYRGDATHYAFPESDGREVLLYPAGTKAAHAEPFATLMSNFTRALSEANNLVSIGYSFQDDHIRRTVLDHLRTNPDLQVVVVGPQPQETLYAPRSSPDAPAFKDYPDRAVGLWFKAKPALEDRKIRLRLNEVAEVDSLSATTRERIAARKFLPAAECFTQLLDQCWRMDMPEKPRPLISSIAGDGLRSAIAQRLVKEAGMLVNNMELKNPYRNKEDEGARLHVGTTDGDRFCRLLLRWIGANVLELKGAVESLDGMIRRELKGWFSGRLLVARSDKITYWPRNGFASAEGLVSVAEEIDGLFQRYGIYAYPGMKTEKGEELQDRVEAFVIAMPSIQILNQELVPNPSTAEVTSPRGDDGEVLIPRESGVEHEKYRGASMKILTSGILDWLPTPSESRLEKLEID